MPGKICIAKRKKKITVITNSSSDVSRERRLVEETIFWNFSTKEPKLCYIVSNTRVVFTFLFCPAKICQLPFFSSQDPPSSVQFSLNINQADLLSNIFHVPATRECLIAVLVAFLVASPEKLASSEDELLKSNPAIQPTLQIDQKNSPGNKKKTLLSLKI